MKALTETGYGDVDKPSVTGPATVRIEVLELSAAAVRRNLAMNV